MVFFIKMGVLAVAVLIGGAIYFGVTGGGEESAEEEPPPAVQPAVPGVAQAIELFKAGGRIEDSMGRVLCETPTEELTDELSLRLALAAYCGARGFGE